DLTTNMSYPGSYDREDLTAVLTATYTQPTFIVTSIAGYGRIESELNGDSNGPGVGTFVPGVPGYTVPIDIDGWSEELRISSNGDNRLTWLTGLYAYRSSTDSGLAFGPVALTSSDRKITNYAGFANAEYALTDTFSVAAGLRYDYEEQEFLNKLSGVVTSKDAKELLPRLSVSYKPSEHMHWYATASRGYHAGGFNDPRAPDTRYDSEYVWNYEVGLKAGSSDNRVQTQITAFYIDWDKQQINQTTNTPGGNSVTYIANAGVSEIYGLETALQWSATEHLSLSGAVSLMHSELKEFEDPIVAPRFGLNQDLAGNELPFAPKFSGTVSGQYLVPIGSGDWEMRLRTDVRYMGSRFFEAVNLIEADPYWLANAYAGIQNERYEIGIYADNVFDEGYLTGGTLPDPVFPAEVTLGTPRMYGIRVAARF
ncbi:MAG: TonB-dependent receptor, partial [Steroidobacteraceae bacterium]